MEQNEEEVTSWAKVEKKLIPLPVYSLRGTEQKKKQTPLLGRREVEQNSSVKSLSWRGAGLLYHVGRPFPTAL